MKPTPRQRQIAEALDTRKRQVEEALEHERFDVRVQRGEWPTEKVGDLFGSPIYRVDGNVPVLALMGSSHGTVMFYSSVLLGRPLDTAHELLVACAMEAWPDVRQEFYVSGAGWQKLKRSVRGLEKRKVSIGIDFGADGRPFANFTAVDETGGLGNRPVVGVDVTETFADWLATGKVKP